jgi:hypothetical protein
MTFDSLTNHSNHFLQLGIRTVGASAIPTAHVLLLVEFHHLTAWKVRIVEKDPPFLE